MNVLTTTNKKEYDMVITKEAKRTRTTREHPHTKRAQSGQLPVRAQLPPDYPSAKRAHSGQSPVRAQLPPDYPRTRAAHNGESPARAQLPPDYPSADAAQIVQTAIGDYRIQQYRDAQPVDNGQPRVLKQQPCADADSVQIGRSPMQKQLVQARLPPEYPSTRTVQIGQPAVRAQLPPEYPTAKAASKHCT
jgi:hypothetical protein